MLAEGTLVIANSQEGAKARRAPLNVGGPPV